MRWWRVVAVMADQSENTDMLASKICLMRKTPPINQTFRVEIVG
jgi:hypothetical protein